MARVSVVLEVSWPASSTSSRLCVISWSVNLHQRQQQEKLVDVRHLASRQHPCTRGMKCMDCYV
jgi:hypothetical protein